MRRGSNSPARSMTPASTVLIDGASVFRDVPPGLHRYHQGRSDQRREYIRLTARQLRSGKLRLHEPQSMRGGGPTFARRKAGGRLREVWHGTRVSEAACLSPRPQDMASPA